MKKISLLLIVSLCMLGGCKDDLLKESGGEDGLTTEGTNYMAFNIVSDGGGAATRASWPGGQAVDDDFNAGSGDEQAITNVPGANVAIFFDEKNNFHSMRNLTSVAAGGTPITDRYDKEGLEVSVGTFTANLKIEEGQEDNLPTKVLIVLNGNPDRLKKLGDAVAYRGDKYIYDGENSVKAANDADFVLSYLTRRLTDEEINKENASVVLFSPSDVSESGSDAEYCTMTSSVYVGSGDLHTDKETLGYNRWTGDIYSLAVFTKDDIKATEDLAKKSPLKVHVERLAVKVEVDINKDKVDITELGGNSSIGGIGEDGKLKFPLLLKPKDKDATQVPQLGEGTDVDDAPKVEWAFAMLGWSTNAVARRMYLFKNLNDAREDLFKGTETPSHYSDNNIGTSFFDYWNDAPHARSYWAVDPHYAATDIYPVQYRYSKDNDVTNTYKDLEHDGASNMPLYYYSYTQMRMISMGLTPSASDLVGTGGLNEGNYAEYMQEGSLRKNLKYRYCAENVLGQELLGEEHVWRGASTHVVFFGQLLLDNEIQAYIDSAKVAGYRSTEKLLNSVPDKLYAAGCYWTRAGYMQYAYKQILDVLGTSTRTIRDYFSKERKDIEIPKGAKLYYVKDGKDIELTRDYFTKKREDRDGTAIKDSLNDVHDNFKFDAADGSCNGDDDTKDCIFRLSAAQVSNGDGRVMLGLKKAYTLKIKSGGTEVSITPEQFLSIAYEFASYADFYAHGRMYYYAPIWHKATGKAYPTEVGDIGVVRNHWYKLTVSSLLKPGIPVNDPSQPIIPNVDPTDRYLGLEIHILPWHVINQTVTLQ